MRDTEVFDEVDDLIPSSHLPLYGFRLVVSTGTEERSMQLCSHGKPDVETLLGALDVAKQMLMKEFLGE